MSFTISSTIILQSKGLLIMSCYLVLLLIFLLLSIEVHSSIPSHLCLSSRVPLLFPLLCASWFSFFVLVLLSYILSFWFLPLSYSARTILVVSKILRYGYQICLHYTELILICRFSFRILPFLIYHVFYSAISSSLHLLLIAESLGRN